MSKKRVRWMLGIALAFVCAAPFLPWQALAQQAAVKREPKATLRIYQTVDTIVAEKQRLTPDEYRRLRRTMIGFMFTERVLGAVLRDPKVAYLKLDMDQLRERILVDDVPDSEFLIVKVREFNDVDAKVVLRAVVDSFMRNSIESLRMNKIDRLEKLRRLWEGYQRSLKAKRTAIRALSVSDNQPENQDLHRQITGKRMTTDLLEIDKLELSKVALATKLERLKALKRVDDEDRKELRRIEDEAAVVEAQLTLLKKRIVVETAILREPLVGSTSFDFTQEMDEIKLASESALKIGKEIELIEIELQAPDPVQVVELP